MSTYACMYVGNHAKVYICLYVSKFSFRETCMICVCM